MSDFISGTFGVDTDSGADPRATTVGTSATRLWESDAKRLMLVFQNLGATVVYLHFSRDVSNTNGLRLAANGGSIVMEAARDGELVRREWFGISSANCVIFTMEMGGV